MAFYPQCLLITPGATRLTHNFAFSMLYPVRLIICLMFAAHLGRRPQLQTARTRVQQWGTVPFLTLLELQSPSGDKVLIV